MPEPSWTPWIECSGCGQRVPLTETFPFACPARVQGDDVDHVLVRRIDPVGAPTPREPGGNPFVAFSELMSPRHRARALGLGDRAYEELVLELDEAIAAVDGTGFRSTPLAPMPELAASIGGASIELWAKDETGNVGGSHKARHLMGVMLHLRVAEVAGRIDRSVPRPPLAIASCGNAALAAAVVARAARWPLRVFVPPDASPVVLARLEELSAEVQVCPRDGRPGDPCVRGFRAALAEGALPFSVQGSDNGMAVEGGLTLGYELAYQVAADAARRAAGGPGRLDVLVVQVGGGALASACVQALSDAVALGVLPAMPRLCTVQTTGAWPLRRAYERIVARVAERAGPLGELPADPRARADWLRQREPAVLEEALRHAATHRSEHMWPWETEPRSVAHGILDDETYDWWALCAGMLRSGGWPEVVEEAELLRAREAVAEHTEVSASATGTAGVAGVIAMQQAGRLRDGEVVATLLTGVAR